MKSVGPMYEVNLIPMLKQTQYNINAPLKIINNNKNKRYILTCIKVLVKPLVYFERNALFCFNNDNFIDTSQARIQLLNI